MRTAYRATAAVVALSFVVRLALVLTHEGYLGVDGGAYVLGMLTVMGLDTSGVTGPGLPRPPLAPGWLLVPFAHLWGVDLGFKLFAILTSMLPLGAIYIVARQWFRGWPLAAVIAFASVDLLQAEMLVTGTMPLVGFSILLIVVWAIGRIAEWRTAEEPGSSWPPILAIVLGLPLIAHTNQTTAGLALIVLPIYAVAATRFMHGMPALPQTPVPKPDWNNWHTKGGLRGEHVAKFNLMFIVAAGVLGGALALTALPWYLPHLPGSDRVHYPGPWVFPAHWADSAWVQAAIAIPIGLYVMKRATAPSFRALGLILAVLGALAPWLSTDESVINIFYRSRYLLTFFVWPCAVFAVPRVLRAVPWKASARELFVLRRVGVATVLILLASLAWGYVDQFNRQAGYSLMVSSTTAEALERTEATGYVTNAFTMALWVAALERVPAAWSSTYQPPAEYREADAHVRCLLGWVPGCDWRAAKNDLAVSHVVIDERFPHYNERAPDSYGAPPDQWQVTAAAPWLSLVFSSGTTRVWRIG